MNKLMLAAAAATLAAATPAAASDYFYFENGNKLLRACDGDAYAKGFCLGYVTGISDALNGFRQVNNLPRCTERMVTTGQARDVVLKYLKDHPEQRHRPAAGLAMTAIVEGFCPSTATTGWGAQ
ncbi:Rap1a/Tai family immunity protein [Sinorhizobium fredii]|uniref:Rap1a/Tai family immunity protein n=1 Tax=Rhizobium fredii TaxID=380 RepID=UPI0030EB5A72